MARRALVRRWYAHPPKYGMRFWHLSVRNIITGDH